MQRGSVVDLRPLDYPHLYSFALHRHTGRRARDYLISRGLDAHTLIQHRIGYVDAPYSGDENFKGMISIPYFTAWGDFLGFRFRNLDTGPKYLSPTGAKPHLYNMGALLHNQVWLTEGEFDALVLTQAGYPAIGTPGVSAFKPAWKWLFAYMDRVTICFDGDKPGREAAHRVSRLLAGVVDDVVVCELPDNEDVTSLWLKDRTRLERAVK